MKIRRLRKKEEIKKVREIWQKELYPELTLKELACLEGKRSQIFLVREKGEIIGALSFDPFEFLGREVILELTFLAIKKKFQRKGIGQELLKKALEKVREDWLKKNFEVGALFVATERGKELFYEKVFPNFEKKVFGKNPLIIYFISLKKG